MSMQRISGEGSFGLSSAKSPIPSSLSDSPWVASVLPRLMRSLADQIERGSDGPATPHLHAARLPQPPTSLDVQSIASQVARDLSITLRDHLGRSLNPERSSQGALPELLRRPVGVPTNEPTNEPTNAAISETPGGRDETPLGGPHLRLKLLGTPEITLDDVRLQALERCGRASLVIYILALHRRGLSGERLAAYIASDSPDIEPFDTEANLGLGAVRTFIWRSRKRAGWRDIVVSPGEQGGNQNRYRLPDDTTCDLWEFERNLDEAARLAVRANVEPDASERAAALRQDAIALYGGEFCKGVGAGSISRAAHYLRQRYLQAVLLQAAYWKQKAVTLQRARQETTQESGTAGERRWQGPPVQEESAWLQALCNYRLAAQAEPCDESIYLGAMLCEAHLGYVRGVEETLALCARVVKVELERDLLPSTIEAARDCMRLAASSGLQRLKG